MTAYKPLEHSLHPPRHHTFRTDMPPIVYLDQNHSITLARARHARDKVEHPDELVAADAIWKAATYREIRLPLSMAHLVETARAGGPGYVR
ncbi:hypothetical protein AB0L65_16980 [Nonomuraea sp. NPDC052116]|uniref:hypothetical protein n=1 Tax=Nonomuraea sp. NPDC052116 TaxID=3155665 RepID=UPI00342BB307